MYDKNSKLLLRFSDTAKRSLKDVILVGLDQVMTRGMKLMVQRRSLFSSSTQNLQDVYILIFEKLAYKAELNLLFI